MMRRGKKISLRLSHVVHVTFFHFVGLRALKTVWAEHISEECKRRFYKNWCVQSP